MRDANDHCNSGERYKQFEASTRKPDNATEDQEREWRATHQIQLAKRLQVLDEHVATLRESVRAAIADVEYARRRAEADLAHAHQFSVEGFARSLLPFKDSLEAALMIRTTDVHALRSGLVLTLKLFQAAVKNQDLVAMEWTSCDLLVASTAPPGNRDDRPAA